MSDHTKESHESYALLRINRTHCGNSILFGSSITHNHTIRLSIHPAEIERQLNHDFYYADNRPYIEVEMSQAQFAEAITSLNAGSGTPVTLRKIEHKAIEDPPFINKRIQFEEEFKTNMQQLENRLSRLTDHAEDILRNKKSINKGDRNQIIKELNNLRTELASNIPFMSTMFNEQMDKTTNETKAEIEAFTTQKIHQLGLEEWRKKYVLTDMNISHLPPEPSKSKSDRSHKHKE